MKHLHIMIDALALAKNISLYLNNIFYKFLLLEEVDTYIWVFDFLNKKILKLKKLIRNLIWNIFQNLITWYVTVIINLKLLFNIDNILNSEFIYVFAFF